VELPDIQKDGPSRATALPPGVDLVDLALHLAEELAVGGH
jgi:hypothetical protein